jgi:hypothetical protein
MKKGWREGRMKSGIWEALLSCGGAAIRAKMEKDGKKREPEDHKPASQHSRDRRDGEASVTVSARIFLLNVLFDWRLFFALQATGEVARPHRVLFDSRLSSSVQKGGKDVTVQSLYNLLWRQQTGPGLSIHRRCIQFDDSRSTQET